MPKVGLLIFPFRTPHFELKLYCDWHWRTYSAQRHTKLQSSPQKCSA